MARRWSVRVAATVLTVGVGLVGVGLVGVGLVAAGPVHAGPSPSPTPAGTPRHTAGSPQDTCGQPVVDNAHVLGNRAGAVRRAAVRLQRAANSDFLAARVRVRVYRNLPTAYLRDQEQADRKACPGWRFSGSELLVLAISAPDRTSNVYYGSDWSPYLSEGWSAIHGAIQHGLRHGGYAAGLVAGLNAIHTAWSDQGSGLHSLAGTRLLLSLISLVFVAPLLVAIIIMIVRRRRYLKTSDLVLLRWTWASRNGVHDPDQLDPDSRD